MSARDVLEADALRAFAIFAEHRNFTTAAVALHISQPSLHVKIAKLGAALSLDLYRREGRRLALTAAGERLAAFALDGQRRLDELLQELHQETPTLRISAGRGALRWVIGAAIQRIGRGGTRVHVLTADRDDALSSLTSGAADVAVIAHDLPPRQLDGVEVASYPQVLMLASDHPLAARRRLRLRDLDGLDLVVPPAGRPHRRNLERALLDAGASWRVAAEVDGWDLLVHLAELGLGATVVNGCVRPPAGLAAVTIADLPRVRYWATWRPQRHAAVRSAVAELRRA